MRASTARKAGIEDDRGLSARDREYLQAWEQLTPEQRKEMAAVGITGPLPIERGPVNRSPRDEDEHDPFAHLAASTPDRYFDDPAESTEDSRVLAGEAVLRVLYLLTGSRHPGLRLATDCLLAIINRSDEKSQAAIARKYGLTRAAVSKRLRDMRAGEFLDGLEIYFFGGKQDVAAKARVRAKRVHRKRKTLAEKTPSKPGLFALKAA
jgi:hypothetical protein